MTIRLIRNEHTAIALLAIALSALTGGAAAAEGPALSVHDAVKMSLAVDQRIASARWDTLAAQAKTDEANRKRLPGVTLSASYTRLSDLKSEMNFAGKTIQMDSLDNVFSLSANMQYPIFAGFRLEESVRLAGLQAEGKEISAEMMKRAITFETERAYWEAVRSSNNVRMLRENLDLMQRNLEQTKQQLAHGTAMNADFLAAQMRCEQAAMDLRNGETVERRAYLSLEALVSSGDGSDADSLTQDPEKQYSLISTPDGTESLTPLLEPDKLDESALIRNALSRRPETQSSALAIRIAESSKKIATAPLYPSLNLTGNYTYADPNSRVYFQSDPALFTGTWNLGLSLSYDLGGVPANLSAIEAQDDGVKKSRADSARQNEVVILDVRSCALAFSQARSDVASVTRMLSQAAENERVMGERLKAGTANEIDFLGAQIARLRSEFAIVNKQIDFRIATADLCRAAALPDSE